MGMIRKYWVTSKGVKGQVNVDMDEQTIISAPPCWAQWIEQPFGEFCSELKTYSLEHLYEDK
jgi:hypothetical protein